MPNQVNGLYEFGPFRLDTGKRLLSRAGESVTLAPKTFDLLLLLVEGHGRVLTKRELMNSLWTDTFVEEASLSYQIAALRKALGKEGDEWIETVPKHGYRFAATATKLAGDHGRADESTDPHPALKARPRQLAPWLIAAIATIAAIAFAVLFFRQVRPSTQTEESVHFLISPPEKVVLSDRGLPVLSPDGKRLAFGGVDPDGKTRLWIRPLSSIEAEAVPGTEGAVSVFWSADGRSLGFFAGGKLKRSDLNGGPPQNLCDASDSLRPIGTWNRDGVILFNSFDRRGLYQVAASGGDPRRVTTLDDARRELVHAWPQFLPDSRHFIFVIQSALPENTGIYVGSLDSGKSKRLLNISSRAAYAALPSGRGYLLFKHAATLMAQPFDTSKLELQNEAVPLAEQIWLPPSSPQGLAVFSASDTGVLCYRTLGQASSQLVWFDREGHRLGALGEAANYSVPALSRDEKLLAVTRIESHIGTRDLWLFDLGRSNASRFTFDPAEETNPTWSPDDKEIAFSSAQRGILDIYHKAITGTGDSKPLFQSNADKIIEGWSPDGKFILYSAEGKLWALSLRGEPKPTILFETTGEPLPDISPNMRWMAYQSNESGRMEIYIQSFPPGDGKWQISTSGGEEPYWRRDGKELFYVAGKRLMAVEIKSDEKAFQWGAPKPLFDVRLEMESRRSRYQVASNGQRFLVNVPLESMLSAPITVVTNWTAGLKR